MQKWDGYVDKCQQTSHDRDELSRKYADCDRMQEVSRMICDCCNGDITLMHDGFVQVTENFGPHEDEDVYIFCSIKCMLGWYQ